MSKPFCVIVIKCVLAFLCNITPDRHQTTNVTPDIYMCNITPDKIPLLSCICLRFMFSDLDVLRTVTLVF